MSTYSQTMTDARFLKIYVEFSPQISVQNANNNLNCKFYDFKIALYYELNSL